MRSQHKKKERMLVIDTCRLIIILIAQHVHQKKQHQDEDRLFIHQTNQILLERENTQLRQENQQLRAQLLNQHAEIKYLTYLFNIYYIGTLFFKDRANVIFNCYSNLSNQMMLNFNELAKKYGHACTLNDRLLQAEQEGESAVSTPRTIPHPAG
ncbi:MAG: hypothetical protein COY58_03770 [Gammaproteobacteria bacterium CG_4_10_14_0_8_um_filter_38_16]|nr:MAG: hypothetical protein COY58_03770 [Gammaproteobacteria bacterium CG_4_10_14_0_8_um_filter_38_16]PJA03696.1 MAG: hypothetical protein COX72_04155 [Gammaproteobacteria bacterium CG_4_10_14_0_2_um_filter_38_22]PJB09642.1 MAG: hypothetical protein CO120_08945 [Gammaproteobacteria bacterium CG_4_9_14_3_um_filter_38_9]